MASPRIWREGLTAREAPSGSRKRWSFQPDPGCSTLTNTERPSASSKSPVVELAGTTSSSTARTTEGVGDSNSSR
eukprot:7098982-Prymnesium_polylepis.2